MEQFTHLFKKFAFTIEELLFPDRCVVCRREPVLICASCVVSLPTSEEPPTGRAALAYRDPTTRKILWLFKYGGRKTLAEPLGKRLAEMILEELSDHLEIYAKTNLVVVPVPLSAQRLKKRKYNQSALLAHTVAQELDLSYCDGIHKTRETTAQMKLGRKDRLRNLEGAFVANPALVKGATILLIDDIITTGATITAATNALTEAGARKVVTFAVAH